MYTKKTVENRMEERKKNLRAWGIEGGRNSKDEDSTKSEFKIFVVVDVALFKDIRQEEQSRYVGGDFFLRKSYGKRQTDNRIDRQTDRFWRLFIGRACRRYGITTPTTSFTSTYQKENDFFPNKKD